LIYGSFFWLQVGLAQIQINRLFLYAVYFLAGIFFGAYGIERTFLVPNSKLARRWIIWTVAALATFLISVIISISSANEILIGFFYIFSCDLICFLIHYGVVSCLSYALLGAQLPAMAK